MCPTSTRGTIKELKREKSKGSLIKRYIDYITLCEEYHVGLRFYVCGETYKPSDDTFMLMELIDIRGNEKVLDLGSGSGIILAHMLLKGASYGLGIDVNPDACISTILTLAMNNVYDKSDVILCDKLKCIWDREEIFDVVVFNPPYLPGTPGNNWIDIATLGGPTGKEVLLSVLESLWRITKTNGRVYTVFSEPPSAGKLLEKIRRLGLIINRLRQRRFFYETLYVVELVKQ